MEMSTVVPFGPLSFRTACSLVQPFGSVLPFDAGDDVAATQTLLERRRPLENRHDGDVAVDHLNLDAEAVILAFLPLAHLRVGARVEEARMRVERLEHAVDRAVDEAVRRHILDVLTIDRRQCRRRTRGTAATLRPGSPATLLPKNPPAIADSTTARMAAGKKREFRILTIVTEEVPIRQRLPGSARALPA